jgi:hypothetical protein
MASAASISLTAEVRKLFWAMSEGEFFEIFGGGALSIH